MTSSLGEENYGADDLPSPEQRYARAAEALTVVNALFDSWQPGALRPDGRGGAVLDSTLVQPIDHAGEHFSVRGPLNIPPLPQGRPVQFQAGQSAGGVELGARFAEVVFTSLPTLEDAVVYTKRIRTRAAELGRPDGLPLIFSSFHATYGATEAEARRLVREERYRANVLDVISLGGLADARTGDFVLNGLLPELRRRGLVDTDYLGGTYRENLELPAPS